MSDKVKNNCNESEKLICTLFHDTGFSGFTFHTSFVLRFSRNKPTEYNGYILPMELEISILSKWWFGSRDEWEAKVKQLTLNRELVEPDEPVLAYELACLRWMNGSEVDEVEFFDRIMQITFKSGAKICISSENDMNYSWVISGCNTNKPSKEWTITCENDDFIVQMPEK